MYDVRLANRRAPGVCFVLGIGVYLFCPKRYWGAPVLAQNGTGVPALG